MGETPGEPRFRPGEPPQAQLNWQRVAPLLPLVAALAAATAAYWPALGAPLYADDYLYLNAARTLSFGDYARAALVPLSDEPLLAAVTEHFWRPLYYLSFEVLEAVFGGHATPYHVLLLAIHLAGIALVWLLARKLTGSATGAGCAAVVFAAHPGGFEGVAWASSLSNVGLPLMLGAWLAFANGALREQPNWRMIWAAAGLFALALGFRESTIVVAGAISAWWLIWWRRDRLGERSTWMPLLPFVMVGAIYQVLRTRFFTEPPANSDVWDLGGHTPDQFWYYLKVTALPVDGETTGLAHGLQVAAGRALLLAAPVLLLFRRWLMGALAGAVLMAIAPYAPLTLAVSERYVYFPAAFLALAIGVLARELVDHLRVRLHPGILWPAVALTFAAALVAGSISTYRRTSAWVASGPDVDHAWVEELRATYPALPAGSTLYCTSTPLNFALFDGALLRPVVGFYYPGVRAEWFDPADLARVRAGMGPDDHIFIPRAGKLE